MTATASTRYAPYDLVSVSIVPPGPPNAKSLGAVRAVVIHAGIEYDVLVVEEDRDLAADLLDRAERGLAAHVAEDHWLLRNLGDEELVRIEAGRRIVVDEPGLRIERAVRDYENRGRVDFEVYVEPFATWPESGLQRPNLTAEVRPVDRRLGCVRPAEVSWVSTSDKRPELARGLSRALDYAASEALRQNEEAGL